MSVKTETSKPASKKTPNAPGQYLGYSLQTTRFLARLLESEPDWFVSLEVFEDVGLEGPQGARIAEQNKSTYDDNPVSDRARDLWKTLSNWVDAVESGELQIEKTLFEIYVSQPRTGQIVRSFSEAQTPNDALQALRGAKKIIWGDAPTYTLKASVSKTIRDYVSGVFSADELLVSKIIQSFTFICGFGSPQEELRILLRKKAIPPECLDDVLDYALGWVKEQTDKLLEQKKPAIIPVETFQTTLVSFVRKLNYRGILTTFAQDPTQAQIESDLRLRTYVRQLELIECDDFLRIRAVTDFLKAASARTHWSEAGLVHESSFDEFEDGLVRTWENQKRKTDIVLSGRGETERGQYLYSECSEHEAKLEGLEVPRHFTCGSFHALADQEAIGWHPDYKNKLTAMLKGKR